MNRLSTTRPTWPVLSLCCALLGLTACPATSTDPDVPLADAGADILSEDPLVEVTLDGSASSSPDGGTLIYHWAFELRPVSSRLTDADIVNNDSSAGITATFAPDEPGLYGLTLQVQSGYVNSDVDFVRVQVGAENEPPIADAGDSVYSSTGENTSLDGGASYDPEGAFLQYRWGFHTLAEDSLLDDADIYNQGTPSALFIPDQMGVYVLSLSVGDGQYWSAPDYVTVTVGDGNLAPTADAGPSQFLTPCSTTLIRLNGNASYDPEGEALTHRWSFSILPEGSELDDALIVDRFTDHASFNWDVPGLYVMELVVNDGVNESRPSFVAIQTVEHEPNGEPVALPPENVLLDVNAVCSGSTCSNCGRRELELVTNSYDPDRDPLTYHWSVVSGDATLLEDSSPAALLEVPPQSTSPGATSETVRTLQLAVNDCQSISYATFTITYQCHGITP